METDESNSELENADNNLLVTEVSIEMSHFEDDLDVTGNPDESFNSPSVVVMIQKDDDETDEDACLTSRKRKQKVKFLDKNTVLSLLLESETDEITIGDKQTTNHYFILKDGEENSDKSYGINDRTFDHIDDHGEWTNTSVKRYHYIYTNGKFKFVECSGGIYQLRSINQYTGKKGLRKAMPKQPSPENILITRKVHSTIKGEIRRRISFIEQFPEGVEPKQRNLILAEYIEDPSYDSKDAKSRKLDCKYFKLPERVTAYDENVLQHEPVLEEVNELYKRSHGQNSGSFFERHISIEILLNSQTVLEELPKGIKENEYFVIKNDDNCRRAQEGKPRRFVDDCGVWKNASSNKHLYGLVDDRYIFVEDVKGEYEILNKQLKECYPEKIRHSQILVMRKYYGTLKRASEYRRRISWIEKYPDGVVPNQEHIALVEYVGKYPDFEVPHGNQKKPGGSPYVRTSAKLMKNMKEKLLSKTPQQALKEYSKSDSLSSSPITLKRLQNLRYRSNYKFSTCNGKDEAHIDEMRRLLDLLHGNNFVQQAILTKGKAPTVIGYTSQQMNFIRHSCQEKPGLRRLLGVDRTMNIGAVSLTALTYPHPNLLCRKNLQPVIMIGPVFFHIDKTWETYNIFFNHLKCCLMTSEKHDIDGISLVCKSEEEESILRALEYSFPSSTVTQPAEHLKANLKEFLTSESGFSDDKVEDITNEIFSELMTCSEECDFDLKLMHLQSDYDGTIPGFSSYISKLADQIKHNLWQPSICWSSETCEAMNSIVSSLNDWNGLKLPELILKIQQIVSLQEQNELSALHSEGHFVLAPHARKYQTNEASWKAKTRKQKARLVESFRTVRPARNGSKHAAKLDLNQYV